jgi:hypothetical protein
MKPLANGIYNNKYLLTPIEDHFGVKFYMLLDNNPIFIIWSKLPRYKICDNIEGVLDEYINNNSSI